MKVKKSGSTMVWIAPAASDHGLDSFLLADHAVPLELIVGQDTLQSWRYVHRNNTNQMGIHTSAGIGRSSCCCLFKIDAIGRIMFQLDLGVLLVHFGFGLKSSSGHVPFVDTVVV